MATIAPIGRYIITDSNGNPLVGGKVNTYESGTTTPKVTYTTQDETTANANPVILDSDGSADIWLGDGGYKFVVTDADDVVLFTTDNLGGNSSAAFGNTVNTITGNTPITDLYANSANVVTAIATLSLLSVDAAGEGFYLTVSNTSTADVTIDPDGAELIDGAATAVIESGKSCLIICDGTEWFTFFLDKLIDLPEETTSIDQDDFITYAKAADGTEYKVTARNFYAFTIDDVSNFNDAPAANDKLIMVNVSNGNANAVEYADLMSIDNLTEDTAPVSGDFLLSYDTSAGTAKKVDFDSFNPINLQAAVATTSGTAIDLTGIPSGVKRVTLNFETVSFSGADTYMDIQLGDSGGIETTGYDTSTNQSNTSATQRTTAFSLTMNNASRQASGFIEFNKLEDHTWCGAGSLNTTNEATETRGLKTLSAELTQLRISGGTFDNGQVSISWEF